MWLENSMNISLISRSKILAHTKAKSSQTHGTCKRFHGTIQEEFYVANSTTMKEHILESIVLVKLGPYNQTVR